MNENELLEDDIIWPFYENEENIKEKWKKWKKEEKKVFAIINWFIEIIDESRIKNTDYAIYSKNWSWFVIYDLDKNKIRPYVMDLLRQMKIETLMSILIKVISIIVFIILIFSFVFFWKLNWLQKSLNSIIETNQNKNIPNNI